MLESLSKTITLNCTRNGNQLRPTLNISVNRTFSFSFIRVCIWADSKCTEIESGCDFIVCFFGKPL